ncbi:hypothetical protein L208DRAFT_1226212, partial [Tricholoma matsutake]
LSTVSSRCHQVVRASTPLSTILFSSIIFSVRSSCPKLIALIPVVAGVGFVTYGDYYFTPWGFFLTLLGTTLAALKTIYTNMLQAPSHFQFSASKPGPRLCYLAAGAIFFGQPSTQLGLSTAQLGLLLLNGVMAFGLNVASFTVNKKVRPLSMTVAENVKQDLMILCVVALFNLTITPTNAVGIVLTLIGGAIYTAVELKEK